MVNTMRSINLFLKMQLLCLLIMIYNVQLHMGVHTHAHTDKFSVKFTVRSLQNMLCLCNNTVRFCSRVGDLWGILSAATGMLQHSFFSVLHQRL